MGQHQLTHRPAADLAQLLSHTLLGNNMGAGISHRIPQDWGSVDGDGPLSTSSHMHIEGSEVPSMPAMLIPMAVGTVWVLCMSMAVRCRHLLLGNCTFLSPHQVGTSHSLFLKGMNSLVSKTLCQECD